MVKAGTQNYQVRVEGLSKQKQQCRMVVNMMDFRNEGIIPFPFQWMMVSPVVTPSGEAVQMPTTSKRGLSREAWAALLRVRAEPECPKGNLRELT